MILSAALDTARFNDSLPTLFILLEFNARFCLVVPKASMQESICAGNKPGYWGQGSGHCFANLCDNKGTLGSCAINTSPVSQALIPIISIYLTGLLHNEVTMPDLTHFIKYKGYLQINSFSISKTK